MSDGRLGSIRDSVRPVHNALIGERYRSGRLQLTGTGAVSRWMATAGVAAIIGLNVSLYLAGVGRGLRRGHLLPLNQGTGAPALIPTSLLPITLLALCLAWILVTWGAAVSSGRIRVLAAVGTLVVNVGLDQSGTVNLHHDAALTWGPRLTSFGYWAMPALLVGAAVAGWIGRFGPRVRAIVLAGLALASVSLFGGLLWIYVAADKVGQGLAVPTLMDFSITNVQNLIIPLVVASALEVLELGYAVSEAAAVPLRRLGRPALQAAVVVLILAKLAIQVAPHTSSLWALVRDRPRVVVASCAAVALLAAGALLVRWSVTAHDEEDPGEAVIYTSTLAMAAALISINIALDLVLMFTLELPWHAGARWFNVSFPRSWLVHYGDVAGGALVLAIGVVVLLRRGRVPIAAGLVLIGGWVLVLSTASLNGLDPGIKANVIDLVVTVAAACFVAGRWRSLTTEALARVGALVLFSWLVGTKGDFLQAWLGRFLPVAAVATVVIGLIWLLLTDSGLAAGHSKVFPSVGRPLLWVGFLLLSVTIANWTLVSHADDFRGVLANRGFLEIGLPLAAWLAAVKRFAPPREHRDMADIVRRVVQAEEGQLEEST